MLALVVDDSRTIRIIIGKVLREVGIDYVEASNGREALDRLREHSTVELILADWNMPIMNGLDLVKAVRDNREYDNLKIVMVTSESEQEQIIKALDAGANEYVMKPFNNEILIAKLRLLDVLGD